MHDQGGCPVQVHYGFFLQDLAVGEFLECLADKEVAVAMHEKNRDTAETQLADRVDHILQADSGIIIADPVLEGSYRIAQDVQGIRVFYIA